MLTLGYSQHRCLSGKGAAEAYRGFCCLLPLSEGLTAQDICSSLSLRDTGDSCQPDRPVPSPGSAQCNGLL